MKLSTGERNRKNFEQARRVLFGTEQIPGTDRERWTTAGKVLKSAEGSFILGPYQFNIPKSGIIFVNHEEIGIIYDDSIRLLPDEYKSIENILDFRTNFHLSHSFTKWNYKMGKFFVNYTEFSERLLPHNLRPEIINADPNDDDAFKKAYSITKGTNESKKIELTIFNMKTGTNVETLYEFTEPFPEGIKKYPDAQLLLSAGRNDMTILLSKYFTQAQLLSFMGKSPEEEELCVVEYKRPKSIIGLTSYWPDRVLDTKLIFLSHAKFITNAIDWLMHVLTGPDPRTYNSPVDKPHPDELKESSEPRKSYFEYYRDEFGVMHLKQKAKRLYFFAKQLSTKQAELIRDETLVFLRDMGGEFAENYARFMNQLPDSPQLRTYPHSPDEFRRALERLKQFTEHEFLGACAACGNPEPRFRCDDDTNRMYCNQECQVVDFFANLE